MPEKARTASNTTPTVEDLSAQINTLRGDLSELTSLLTGYGQDQAEQAGEKARDAAARLQARAKLEARHMRNTADEYTMQAEDFMHQHPGASLGIAAGIGFLVGLMTSRK